ncbi:hypothetical protein FRB95_007415 [Tulasnella sp. JGI-2019a]|nr:hypothetical protein FRB95_007415 [Tulasnella sp. JGI-2019a]
MGTSIEPDQTFRSTPRVEWLSFSGGLSDNVIAFAQGVHRFGFAYGRVEDDIWMARYVYGCLSGDALEWFEHLDPEIKEDWSKLRPIMIEKFKQSRASASRSRIKVVKQNGTVPGYLSRPHPAHAATVVSADEALVLEASRAQDTHVARVKMLNCSNSDTFPFLGLEIQDGWWELKACDAEPEGSVFKGRGRADTTTEPMHPASSKIWTIKKIDGPNEQLCPQWIEDGAKIPLYPILRPKTLQIFMYRDPHQSNGHNDEPVSFILEHF